jgi:hypothetical protein
MTTLHAWSSEAFLVEGKGAPLFTALSRSPALTV